VRSDINMTTLGTPPLRGRKLTVLVKRVEFFQEGLLPLWGGSVNPYHIWAFDL